MNLHRIIPRIDMPFHAARIFQISCRAEERPGHVHQLAEGKIRHQNADKKEMDVKEQADFLWRSGVKAKHLHDQPLHRHEIHFINQSHEHAGRSHAKKQEEGKVIRKERNVTDLGNGHPSKNQVEQRDQDHNIGDVKHGHEVLEDFV